MKKKRKVDFGICVSYTGSSDLPFRNCGTGILLTVYQYV